MGLFFAMWRRLFGGADIKYDFLEERGVQCVIMVAVLFVWELLAKGFCWYLSLAIAVMTYIFWSGGHFYYFKMGTESDAYIDAELAKGRKPAMHGFVKWVNTFRWFRFKERSKQYCFVGMAVRYFVLAFPVACFVGKAFGIAALAVPFIYAGCFWVEFPETKYAKSPTNWAEIFSGLFIGWALL